MVITTDINLPGRDLKIGTANKYEQFKTTSYINDKCNKDECESRACSMTQLFATRPDQ